ncbi:hypothetical protein ABH935_009330 [Catenulispora sp. GAS73]|uniref:hypothetical protein n=1 Tax=Catenulispora sp. GAS73 TaxID=3156269 RepID=UPI003514B41C
MEQNAHDVFARVAEWEGPPLGFTVDDLVAGGRRYARTRRLGAVAGGAVGVLAVTAVMLPLTAITSGGSAVATPGGPGTHPAAVAAASTPDSGCEADLAKFVATVGVAPAKADKEVTLQICPLAKQIMAAMDMDVTHWSQASGALARVPADLVYSVDAGGNGVTLHPMWTPDGHFPYKGNDTPQMVGGDFVDVGIAIAGPSKNGLHPGAAATNHTDLGLTGNGKAAAGKPWDPPTTTTLPDGSTVKIWMEQDSAGAEYTLIRTLRTGEQLELTVNGPFSSTGKPTTNRLPFTEQQMIDAVSVPGIEDVALSVPSMR